MKKQLIKIKKWYKRWFSDHFIVMLNKSFFGWNSGDLIETIHTKGLLEARHKACNYLIESRFRHYDQVKIINNEHKEEKV